MRTLTCVGGPLDGEQYELPEDLSAVGDMMFCKRHGRLVGYRVQPSPITNEMSLVFWQRNSALVWGT